MDGSAIEEKKKKRNVKSGDAINIEEDEGEVAISKCVRHNKKARCDNTQQSISLPQNFQTIYPLPFTCPLPFLHFAQLQIGYCTYLSTMLEERCAHINKVWEQLQKDRDAFDRLQEAEFRALRDRLQEAEFRRNLDNFALDIENSSFGSFENMCMNLDAS